MPPWKNIVNTIIMEKKLVADHALGAQRVSAHGRDAQRDGGAQHGVQDGVAVGTENTVVLEHIAVGFWL